MFKGMEWDAETRSETFEVQYQMYAQKIETHRKICASGTVGGDTSCLTWV